jgi:dolichyl-phosphate-mannose-protein mannosyltransferase
MLKKLLSSLDLIFLFVLSFFTRFWHLFYPAKVIFDEAHFGLYATKYLSRQYYFDIHPPLGKMLLALAGYLGGLKSGFQFEPGAPYGDFNFLALRFLPAFLGSFLIIIVYLFVREIGFSRRVAFLSGFLLLFDNALITQSRFILLDVILLFFIFLTFYLYILTKRFPSFSLRWYALYILTGLSLGAAISIKWTGLGILGVIWFLSIFKDNIFSSFKKENLIKIGLIFISPFLVYFLIFTLHFYLLPFPCTENCGVILNEFLAKPESAFFNNPPAGNLITKFLVVNKLMLAVNLASTMPYFAQSDWFSWPFMIRPVPYFTESQNNKISSIYFFGNPVVWWLGIIGILGYFYLITKNYFSKFRLKLPQVFYSQGYEFLILGYLFYFIPFASIKRFMLIYHYLPALTFSVILFSVFFDTLLRMKFNSESYDKFLFKNKKANFVFLGVLSLIFISFLFFLPFTYGFPLSENGFKLRIWLDTWSF